MVGNVPRAAAICSKRFGPPSDWIRRGLTICRSIVEFHSRDF
jgi:hypothetical protein